MLTILLLLANAFAQFEPQDFVDPQTYTSPSGEYSFHSDPSAPFGDGPSDCRLTRNGAEVWQRRLPFTFFEAAVTDSGTTAGYALPDGRQLGDVVIIAIIGRDGVSLAEHTIARDVYLEHNPPTPLPERLSVDPEQQAMTVWSWNPRLDVNQSWWRFDLATGDRLPDWEPTPPKGLRARSDAYLGAARRLPDTDLQLLQWRIWRSSRESYARFEVIRSDSAPVWSLESETMEFLTTGRERESREAELEQHVRNGDVVLDVASGGRFSIWSIEDSERIDLEAIRDPTAATGWRVIERAHAHYEFPESTASAVPADAEPPATIELEPIERAELPWDMTEGTPRLGDATIDALGRILVLDEKTWRVHVFTETGTIESIVVQGETGLRFSSRPSLVGELDGGFLLRGSERGLERASFERFDADGRRVGVAPFAWGVAASDEPGRYWVFDYKGGVTLRDSHDRVLRAVSRLPDRRWLRAVQSAAVDPDGVLVAISTGVLLFVKKDASESTIRLPADAIGARRCAATRDWILLSGSFGEDAVLFRRADHRFLKWTNPGRTKNELFTLGLSPDGRELWALDLTRSVLDRYALPEP